MNCPSRTDNLDGTEGWNQNPNQLESSTRQDLANNGTANSRLRRVEDPTRHDAALAQTPHADQLNDFEASHPGADGQGKPAAVGSSRGRAGTGTSVVEIDIEDEPRAPGKKSPWSRFICSGRGGGGESSGGPGNGLKKLLKGYLEVLVTFGKFIGPGFMVSVAYIDPGNYSTDVAGGASFQFKLLFVVLMSNIFAIFLQSLCIKLGTVTGMNLAEHCRAVLPTWLNIFLYLMAEAAIIATDIAEVIGTAIAINLLIPAIPLVAGCALSILDVLLILLLYRPNGSMKGLRAFEMFVVALVLGVVVCFCIQLALIENTSIGEVFKGYLPSSAVVQGKGLYQACGILGATVMPHSLFLGSGIVQPRLLEYDIKNGTLLKTTAPSSHPDVPGTPSKDDKSFYHPSISAINFCLNYSYAELCLSLFTFALFVNSAILIVAGASLYPTSPDSSPSLFSIHDLLSSSIAPAAGTIFALALLLSGVSAGVICTIAGQMVSEGHLNWTLPPWLRRLVTRSISITPSIIIAGAVGRNGLDAALNATQVTLSVVLPFVSAPLIYFTCRGKYMTVHAVPQGMGGVASVASGDEEEEGIEGQNQSESRNDGHAGAQSGGETSGDDAGRRSKEPSGVDEQPSDDALQNSETAQSWREGPRRRIATSGALPTATANTPSRNLSVRSRTTLRRSATVNEQNGSRLRNDGADGTQDVESGMATAQGPQTIHMKNHWITAGLAIVIWLVITVMNVANLVLLGLGD